MRQLNFNTYERIVTQDLNNLQLALGKSLQDDFLYNFLGQANGVLGSSFTPSYVSALVASMSAGVGFFYDNTQTGYNPLYRMVLSPTAITANITAADTQDRIDKLVLAPTSLVTATASRYIKTGGVGPIVLTTVDKDKRDSYTLTVVKGTPAGSPVAPATPAGTIPIATCYIHANTGMTGTGDVTDLRSQLSFSVNNSGHVIATSLSLQGQLDQLDAGLSKTRLGNGSVSVSTATYAVTTANMAQLLRVDTTANAIQLNLPTPASMSGKTFSVVDIGGNLGTNALTFHRNAAENFQGVAADYVARAPYGTWDVYSDGTNWILI
jgi:hypothetical protein